MFPALPALNHSSFNFQFKTPKMYPLKRNFSEFMQSSFQIYPSPYYPPPPPPHPERSCISKPRKKLKTDQNTNPKHCNFTSEESKMLLEKWKQGSFAGFYQWVQLNKADLKIDFKEIEAKGKNKNPSFQCTVQLSFHFKSNPTVLTSTDQGESKKEAKRKTFEKIVENLLKCGAITPSLLKEKLSKKEMMSKKTAEISNFTRSDEIFPSDGPKVLIPICDQGKNLKKQVNKFVMQIKDRLKKDKFYEACALFCKILDLKQPEWKEVIFSFSSFK